MTDDEGFAVYKGLVDGLVDGQAVETVVIDGLLGARVLSFAELAPILSDSDYVGFMGQVDRPGVIYLQRYLELHYFPPFTPRNQLFRCFVARWMGLEWSLTIFPWQELDPGDAQRATKLAGLRAIEGVPAALVHPGEPLRNGSVPSFGLELFANGFMEMDLPFENVRFLENVPGHLVYTDPRAAHEHALEMDRRLETEWEASRRTGVMDF